MIRDCTYSRKGMQRDSLESDEVVPAWDTAGDRRGPGVVVVDHLP